MGQTVYQVKRHTVVEDFQLHAYIISYGPMVEMGKERNYIIYLSHHIFKSLAFWGLNRCLYSILFLPGITSLSSSNN